MGKLRTFSKHNSEHVFSVIANRPARRFTHRYAYFCDGSLMECGRAWPHKTLTVRSAFAVRRRGIQRKDILTLYGKGYPLFSAVLLPFSEPLE